MTTSTVQACARCGTPIVRVQARGFASRIYCRRACAELAAQKRRRDRLRAALPPVTCAVCSRPFPGSPARRYCSEACRNRRPRPPRLFAERRCLACREPFGPTWARQAYCGLACRPQSRGDTRHGGVQAPAAHPARPPRSTEDRRAIGTPAVSLGGRDHPSTRKGSDHAHHQ